MDAFRFALVIVVAAGCATTTTTADGASDAGAPEAAVIDVAPADMPPADVLPLDALLCGAPRMCFGTFVPSEVLTATCVRPDGRARFETLAYEVSFCHCLHGSGTGVDGTLSFRVVNESERPIAILNLVTLSLTADDGGALSLGPCCSRNISRSYTCVGEATPWSGRVDPGRTELLTVSLHLDAPEVSPGRYRARVALTVDDAPVVLDFGERIMELVAPH